ncbi:TetR/AcrR family transcriptional regulator [Crossiella cryophila]|uniref:AcrR family transcriptional regulator n=1 Tax=Crossiella cryophila TaxID=43355 RepID=A0A7W7CC55_9PSEU|nr:TetR/AcrR family transcriptional regulator [Crossiella cryophila]MBB4677163.1 AcrR family transcriptional regulator [Crossiella cryophila]
MVVYAAQGDAARSMALLWQGTSADLPKPGPKQGLDLAGVVTAAIEVADAEGMAALSMRAVGQRLGRTAMALYTYVPNKNELLDLMYDRVLTELPTEYDLTAGWRAAITAWAEDTWEFYLRHPWVLQVSQARPVLGPGEFTVMETMLRLLFATGLDTETVRRLAGALAQYVRGAAQPGAESRQSLAVTGVSDDDWWYARSAQLGTVAPDFRERFPLLGKLDQTPPAEDHGEQPYLEWEARKSFEVGLAVLLDGVAARRIQAGL